MNTLLENPNEADPPVFVVTGLRGRPIRQWRDNLVALLLILSPLTTAAYVEATELTAIAILSLVCIGFVLWKFARGRITVYRDRIEMFLWDDFFPRKPVVIPFARLTRVAVYGTTLRVYNARPGDAEPELRKIFLAASVAEDLFDHLAAELTRSGGAEFVMDSPHSVTRR